MMDENNTGNPPDRKRLLISFVIELVIYSILVTGYAYVVLSILGDFLFNLFNTNLAVYAFLGLGLIVAQGVLLDFITTFLIERLKYERFE